MSSRLAPLGVLLLLATAAPAEAAKVSREYPIDPFGSPYGEGTVKFTGAPGEANRLEIRLDAEGVTLADAANPIENQADCQQIDANTVRCVRGGLSVDLGDGDDTAAVTDPRTGPVAQLPIVAGTGIDTVTGSANGELFLDGGGGEADSFSGGGGDDTVSYEGRRASVRVILGASGEDVFDGIASVVGGSGDDTLVGDAAANTLSGAGGDDRVEGRAGADELYGSGGDDRLLGGAGDDRLDGDTYLSATGRDTLEGGPGDDLLDLSAADDEQLSIGGPTYEPFPDGRRDVARCGAGTDTTMFAERQDSESSCEGVMLGPGFAFSKRLERISRSRVRLTMAYGAGEYFGFRVHLAPRRGKPSVKLTRPVRFRDRRTATLRLTAAGRRYLRHSRAVRVVVPYYDDWIDAVVTRR
jgi:hypothetical protein